MNQRLRLLFVEPYYGGSHKHFISGLKDHLQAKIEVISLPARKWKMKMQLAAPFMAQKIEAKVLEGKRYDGMLTSTFIDVGVLRSLLFSKGIMLPAGIYFHENQFAYPSRIRDPSMHQFTAINFNSALCADRLAFNSRFNRDTFLNGLDAFLKKAVDLSLSGTKEALKEKSAVIYPGMDFSLLDRETTEDHDGDCPVLVWNHRWEHDKNPELFFKTLIELADEGLDFKIIVLGKAFRSQPGIFARAREALSSRIIHFGFAEDRKEYYRLLKRGTIAVSTAYHEFFGMAMLEAVRAGCLPFVPDRLAYKEIFPPRYRYRSRDFKRELAALIMEKATIDTEGARRLTESYSWPSLVERYERWFYGLSSTSVTERIAMSAKNTVLSE